MELSYEYYETQSSRILWKLCKKTKVLHAQFSRTMQNECHHLILSRHPIVQWPWQSEVFFSHQVSTFIAVNTVLIKSYKKLSYSAKNTLKSKLLLWFFLIFKKQPASCNKKKYKRACFFAVIGIISSHLPPPPQRSKPWKLPFLLNS